MGDRFRALARGSQPAVVKLASFGGAGRLGALANYVSRSGEIALENHLGQQLRGRDQISTLSTDWQNVMSGRAESRDIGLFQVDIRRNEPLDRKHARQILRSGFGDRSFVFAISPTEDGHRINGVVVLRDRNGERLTADAKAAEIVQQRLDTSKEANATEARIRFTGYGNGVEYGTSRVRRLVEEQAGRVEDQAGKLIGNAKQAGDLVQLEWRDQLHSRKSRDVMHLIMSARAGTDVGMFRDAAREFLAAEFNRHKYVFAVHDPSDDPKAEQDGGRRPHVHVHAVVAMRSDDGERVETSIASFRRWRESLAEHARAKGIAMEMTDRRDTASAPSYGRNQVRPVNRSGRTEHEGTSELAQDRYARKRQEAPSAARTQKSISYTEIVYAEWSKLNHADKDTSLREHAEHQLIRIESAGFEGARSPSTRETRHVSDWKFQTEIVTIQKVVEVDNMGVMTRSEFEAYEKRVETALFTAEKAVPAGERESFDEIVSAARAHVDVRREMMEQSEMSHDDDSDRNSGGKENRDDANERWDAAVARHGLQVVEAANEIMLQVEHFREAIELTDVGEIQANKASLQASLQHELTRAAELGAAGNGMVREISEVDEELRTAIEAAERRSERVEEKRKDSLVVEGDGRISTARPADRDEIEVKGDGHQDRRTDGRAGGDTTSTDPAKQHVPRLEEIQREADERAERDRDDHDR
ncbi:conjugal transfer protein TraA [Rhizobium terrae]|uniref:conjugal transfer protein TraA n=1 Tax=Rhizobium terrae TaxID=2171756 RepID=UPI0013C357E7|nr:conjugal transfer protein TraA [Rhizobium terrae]